MSRMWKAVTAAVMVFLSKLDCTYLCVGVPDILRPSEGVRQKRMRLQRTSICDLILRSSLEHKPKE